MQEITHEMKTLIGQQVSLQARERSFTIGSISRKSISYSLDPYDPLIIRIKNLSPKTRIIIPGTICTQDIRSDRLNVIISRYGIIERIYYG